MASAPPSDASETAPRYGAGSTVPLFSTADRSTLIPRRVDRQDFQARDCWICHGCRATEVCITGGTLDWFLKGEEPSNWFHAEGAPHLPFPDDIVTVIYTLINDCFSESSDQWNSYCINQSGRLFNLFSWLSSSQELDVVARKMVDLSLLENIGTEHRRRSGLLDPRCVISSSCQKYI